MTEAVSERIRFTCPACGAGHSASPRIAGQKKQCGQCEAPVWVPIPVDDVYEPEPPADDWVVMDDEEQPQVVIDEEPQPRRRPTGPRRRRRATAVVRTRAGVSHKSSQNLVLMAVFAGVAVLVGLTLMVALWP